MASNGLHTSLVASFSFLFSQFYKTLVLFSEMPLTNSRFQRPFTFYQSFRNGQCDDQSGHVLGKNCHFQ